MKPNPSKYNLVEWYKSNVDYEKHRSRSDKDHQFVYLFGNPKTQRVKIGISNDPVRRFAELERMGGSYLSNIMYLKIIPGTDEAPEYIEKQLHRFFKEKRKVGEWSELSVKDIIQIRNLFYHIYGEDIQDDTDNLRKFFIEKTYTGIGCYLY